MVPGGGPSSEGLAGLVLEVKVMKRGGRCRYGQD